MENVPESVRTVKAPTIPPGDDDFGRESVDDFQQWTVDQADRVRLQGGPRAEWLAARIDRLASLIRYFAAADGSTLDDREQVAEEAYLAVSRN